MKRMSTLIAGLLTLIAFTATANTASADMGDYAWGMEPFAPVIERWATEAQELTTAALAKPELACSAEMAEMTLRGRSIADDLDGMTRLAPEPIVLTHVQLSRSVRVMAAAAGHSCEDAAAAVAEMEVGHERFAGPMSQIHAFVNDARGIVVR